MEGLSEDILASAPEGFFTPRFTQEGEGDQYFEEALRGGKLAWANGGMAIRVSDENLAGGVAEARGIPTIAATMCGYPDIQERLGSYKGQKMEVKQGAVLEANKTEFLREINHFKEKSPNLSQESGINLHEQ